MLIDLRQFLYDSVEKILFKADFFFLHAVAVEGFEGLIHVFPL